MLDTAVVFLQLVSSLFIILISNRKRARARARARACVRACVRVCVCVCVCVCVF